MCGGYELDADPEALIRAFRVDSSQLPLPFDQPIEHFPKMRGPIVISHRDAHETSPRRILGLSQWGLVPRWAKDVRIADKLYNARAETLASKPSFRESFRARRCVVPVTAFYEWQRAGGKSARFVFRAPHSPLMALAGLWDLWRGPAGERVGSFTIVTVDANSDVSPVHPRMPVVLDMPQVERWLAQDTPPSALEALLVPCAGGVLDSGPG